MISSMSLRSLIVRLAGAIGAASLAAVLLGGSVTAQVVGRNVNIVGGPAEIAGDASGVTHVFGNPNLQKQNEPSMACSSRNPLNCLAGTNDYRLLDIPGVADGKVTADAWLGVFWTRDGGQSWRSTLLPGFPQDASDEGFASPAKGFGAAADPRVRTGANGLFFYSGIAFDREAIKTNTAGVEGRSGVLFVSRFIDDNNTQHIDTPFRYLGTSAIAHSTEDKFLDMPSLAVDIPRQNAGTCHIPAGGGVPAQSFPAGNVYVVYSVFMGDDNLHTKLMFARSTDCGQTWQHSVKLSQSHKINQSGQIAIHPETGQILVAWREFNSPSNSDQILVAKSDDFGQTFKNASVVAELKDTMGNPAGFDQPTLPVAEAPNFRMFRTNSYPTTCVAGNGHAYLAWSQRGVNPEGDARVMYTRSADGIAWTLPAPVDNHSGRGHQFMPALGCAGTTVTLIWYDQRADAVQVFNPFIADPIPQPPARSLDVRSAQTTAGSPFGDSQQVSRYMYGIYTDASNNSQALQLEYNLENLPLFAGAQMPFIGDYIDVAPSPTILPEGAGDGLSGTTGSGFTFKNKNRATKLAAKSAPNGWVFNTSPVSAPVFHAVWTDNRDVKPGDYENLSCFPGTMGGTKNQNVYTARLTEGVVAGALGNARPYGTFHRAFAFFVQNATGVERTFELTIANDPPGGKASFLQFHVDDQGDPIPLPPALSLVDGREVLTVTIGPRSTIARTVFVTADTSDPAAAPAPVRVDVDEVLAGPGTPLRAFVVLNPDPSNPAPLDFDLVNFDETHMPFISVPTVTDFDLGFDPANPNFLNPNFLNPNFLNPNFLNPNFLNPNFLNPNFLNPNFLNPNFLNPNVDNPNFLNPNFLNPNFLNPNFLNPNFLNVPEGDLTVTEITWTAEAAGNTASSYLFRPVSDTELPENWGVQLLIYRLYFTPTALGTADPCGVGEEVHQELVADILNPNFLNPNFLNPNFLNFANPNFLNTALDGGTGNATFALAAGDTAQVTLRILHDGTFVPETVSAVVIAEAVDSFDAADGVTTPVFTFTVATLGLPAGVLGVPYSQQLEAAGGTPPYAWAVTSGALPAGLSLDGSTGLISGTPTGPVSTSTFTVTATDASTPVRTAARPLSIDIAAPQLDFLVQPTDEPIDLRIAPTVTATATHQGEPVSGLPLSLTIASGPSGASLLGNSAVTDNTGTAAFPNLRLDTAGTYTLAVTVGGAESASSASFTILPVSGQVTDPAGDVAAGSPDLVSAQVSRQGPSLTLQVTFAPGTLDPLTTRATFVLDVDQDRNTGFPGVDAGNSDSGLMGHEFLVSMGSAFLDGSSRVATYTGTGFTSVTGPPVDVLADGYQVSIPLSLLGGDDGRLNYKVIVQSQVSEVGFTGIVDYMPNLGLLPGSVKDLFVDPLQPVIDGASGTSIGVSVLNGRVAQTFTPSVSGDLTEVRFAVGGATSDVVVEIQTLTQAGVPSGTVLATQTLSAAEAAGSSAIFRRIIFTSPLAVTAGTPLAVVLRSPNGDAAITDGPTGNFYGGGDAFFAHDGNEQAWVAYGPSTGRFDFPFQVVIESPGSPEPEP